MYRSEGGRGWNSPDLPGAFIVRTKIIDKTKDNQVQAVRILLDQNNLFTLSSVFTTIMRSMISIYDDLNNSGKELIDKSLLELFKNENYLTKIEINLNYVVQI